MSGLRISTTAIASPGGIAMWGLSYLPPVIIGLSFERGRVGPWPYDRLLGLRLRYSRYCSGYNSEALHAKEGRGYLLLRFVVHQDSGCHLYVVDWFNTIFSMYPFGRNRLEVSKLFSIF
ncbi:hypothetical protein AVEN_177973-1 [Araneus ventricosus]|uniref:Uncharacterized protein n=1 Tax=Araneus ventricosus TaxID=182803 RepID=A0A4Y2EIZ3_ARAVE|nr:hypothetical protein AVEN_177973-1 [Araneus ventricosus]